MPVKSIARLLIQTAQTLREEVEPMRFAAPVTHVYHPLDYAWKPHEAYLRAYGATRKRVVFWGMNPGPFGMMQTGIPFGEIRAVRDWMAIQGGVRKPVSEHPQRKIEGFSVQRSEVSGRRLWGLFGSRYPRARDFFSDHLVLNYCPLVFLESTGRNRTPDRLPGPEAAVLFAACDRHLRSVVEILEPEWLIGVGGFVRKRLQHLFTDQGPRTGGILHPSPASPAANRGWADAAVRQLEELGVW